jgi:hypothetical protein
MAATYAPPRGERNFWTARDNSCRATIVHFRGRLFVRAACDRQTDSSLLLGTDDQLIVHWAIDDHARPICISSFTQYFRQTLAAIADPSLLAHCVGMSSVGYTIDVCGSAAAHEGFGILRCF